VAQLVFPLLRHFYVRREMGPSYHIENPRAASESACLTSEGWRCRSTPGFWEAGLQPIGPDPKLTTGWFRRIGGGGTKGWFAGHRLV